MASSDGRVVIDVILNDGTVARGVVNLDRRLGTLYNSGRRAADGIKQIAVSLGVVAVASKAINMLKNSIDGAISRYDTLTGFPSIMEKMGFSAEQSKNSIDKLSKGIDGLPTTLDSIVDSTKRIALLTGDLDKATDTALALNNAFLASGSSAADAERGLVQYLQMLSKGTVDIVSWRTLQETMPYALRETAAAFGYTGKAAQNDLYKALQSGKITFEQFNDKIIELSNKTGGFAEVAKTSTSGIATAFSNMKTSVVRGLANVIAAIDDALGGTGKIAEKINNTKDIIDEVFKVIVKAIPVIADGIKKVKAAFEEWAPTINIVIALLTGLAVGIATFKVATFIVGIMSITKAFLALKSAMETVAIASMLLWDVLKANPIITIISILAGLAAMFVYLYKTNETFRNAVNKVGAALKSAFEVTLQKVSPYLEKLVQLISSFINATKTTTISIFAKSMDFLGATVEKVSSFFIGLKESLSIKDALSSLIGPLVTVATFLFNIASPIGWLIKGFSLIALNTTLFSDALSVLKGEMSIGELVNNFAGDLSNLITNIANNASKMITTGAQLIVNLIEGISAQLPTLINTGVTIITSLINGLSNSIVQILPVGVQIISQLINSLLSAIPQLLQVGLTILTTLIDTIVTNLPMLINVGIQIITTLIDTFVSMLPQLISTYLTLIQTLIDTITSMLPSLISVVINLVLLIVQTIIDNLPLIIDAGIQILTALIDGIITLLPSLIDAIISIIMALVDVVIENLPLIIDAGIQILMSLINGIIKVLPALINAAVKLITSIVNALINNLPKIIDAGIKILQALINGIIKVLPQLINAAIKLIISIADALIKNLPKIIQAGGQILLALVKGVLQLIGQLGKLGIDLVTKLAQSVVGAVPKMIKVGGDLVRGLWEGIKNVKKWILSKISGFVDSIIGGFKKFFDTHSPSRKTEKIGKDVGLGVGKGIDKSTKTVKKSTKKFADDVIKDLELKFDTGKISAKKYIKELEKVRKNYKLTSDQVRKIEKEIYNANKIISKNNSKAAGEAIKNLETKFDTGKINATQYINGLKKIQKNYKLTGDQARKVAKEIDTANKTIEKSVKNINKDVEKANKTFLSTVQKINKQLQSDIKKLKDNFNKELADLTKSIYNQVGLFEKVETKKADGTQLLKNLQDQNTQFKEWQKNINKIAKNGAPKAFVDELRAMGVDSAAEIEAIANMSKKQLNEYVKAWKEKHKLAKEEATTQMADAKKQMENQIKKLTDAANKEIEKAKTIWKNSLSKLASEVKKLGSFKNSGKVLGKDTVNGLVNGLKSMDGPLKSAAKSLAKTIEKEIKKTLKIKSPSRLMRDEVGKMIPAGVGVGVEKYQKLALNSVKSMAKKLTNEASSVTNRLRNAKLSIGNIAPMPAVAGGYGIVQTNTPRVVNELTVMPGDVILDGRKVGDVIWQPVNERIKQDENIRNKFKKG